MAERILSLPRARNRVPVLRMPAPRPLLLGVGILVLGALCYLGARQSSLFAVERIEVAGAPPAVAAQARAAVAFAAGDNLLRLDGHGVVAALERLPTVSRAAYDRDFPHTLRLRIVPEQPVAVLRRGADSWLVSARGRVIGTLERGKRPSLPRIWLRPTALVQLGEILRDPSGSLGSRALASFRGAGLGGRISFVRADGGRLVVGLRTGLEVRLGPPVDVRLKLAIVRSILPTLALPSAGGPRYLDVAVPERPVAGFNPQPEG